MLYSTECYKDDINYEHVQKSDLLDKYKDGETVKLSCTFGYVGSFRIACENGVWKKTAGRDCKSRNPLDNSKYL